jgi:hypothetical protein
MAAQWMRRTKLTFDGVELKFEGRLVVRRRNLTAQYSILLGTAATLWFMTAARAQESAADPAPAMKAADAAEKADGTLSPAAKAAIEHGPLPFSDATAAAKADANHARDEAEKKGAQRPFSSRDLAPAGQAGAGLLAQYQPLGPIFVNIPCKF